MITLYQFPPMWGVPNLSPFCMKLETYLRIQNIPYHTKLVLNPAKGPKHKIPFVKLADGTLMGDSGLIIDYLEKQAGDKALDAHLSTEQKASALALRRLLEEHLYWIVVWSRFIEDTGWRNWSKNFQKSLPPIVKSIVPMLIRRAVKKGLYAVGIGRHTPEQILQLGFADIDAMADLLGNKTFLFNEQASTVDAALYAAIGSLAFTPWPSPLKDHILQKKNLIVFYNRITQQYFSKFKTII